MTVATLTSKGQVTIPKAVRDELGLRPGVRLEFTVQADGTIRVRPKVRDIRDMIGCLKTDRHLTLEEIQQAIEDGVVGAPMIALDTNVLLRLLTGDDAEQTACARRSLDRVAAAGEVCFVSTVVLCETVWLARAYRLTRAEIASTVEDMLGAGLVVIERPSEVARALHAFVEGRGDLSDYVIRERARSAGAANVVTFDRRLLGEPGFLPVDPPDWPEGFRVSDPPPRYGRLGRRTVTAG